MSTFELSVDDTKYDGIRKISIYKDAKTAKSVLQITNTSMLVLLMSYILATSIIRTTTYSNLNYT